MNENPDRSVQLGMMLAVRRNDGGNNNFSNTGRHG
jgi:hypothetical protein